MTIPTPEVSREPLSDSAKLAAWFLYERESMAAMLARNNRRGKAITRGDMSAQIHSINPVLAVEAAYVASRQDKDTEVEAIQLSLAINSEVLSVVSRHLSTNTNDFSQYSEALDRIADSKEKDPFEGSFTNAKNVDEIAEGIDFMTASVVDSAIDLGVISNEEVLMARLVEAIDRVHGEQGSGPLPFTKISD